VKKCVVKKPLSFEREGNQEWNGNNDNLIVIITVKTIFAIIKRILNFSIFIILISKEREPVKPNIKEIK
jgi:hypothetical protein